jgi:ectoine hydroxylase-related dioxygenase (phytanoyl-CoA dioxygenase family)
MVDTNNDFVSFFADPELALKNYHAVGYHIEPDIYTDAECAELIAASQELENARNGTYRPQMMPHRDNPVFLRAMRKENIANIIGHLVVGKAAGLQTEFFYGKPSVRGFSLHQDNFFVQAPLGAFASAWVALTDTYPEKGGLIVYPGSHHEGLLPTRKLNLEKDNAQDPNANNEESIVPAQYKLLNVSVPQGAGLFLHGCLVHGSNANRTNEWRYVLLNTYIREGEPFRAGNYARREAVSL